MDRPKKNMVSIQVWNPFLLSVPSREGYIAGVDILLKGKPQFLKWHEQLEKWRLDLAAGFIHLLEVQAIL